MTATALALLALWGTAWATDPSRAQSQTVDGIAFHYGVVPAQRMREHTADHVERTMHGGPKGSSHIVVALFDAATGDRIADARVRASVTPLGGAVMRKPLEPMTIAGAASFGNYFHMAAPGVYRIRVDVDRPGRPRTIAEFEYRVQR